MLHRRPHGIPQQWPHLLFHLYCSPEPVFEFCVVMHRNHQTTGRQWPHDIQSIFTLDQEAQALVYMAKRWKEILQTPGGTP